MPDASPPSARRMILALAVPMMVLRIVTMSTYIVDAAVCGRLHDAGAQLAGMAVAFQIIVVMEMTANGLVIGAIVLISRARGGNDPERARQVMDQIPRLVVAAALVLAPIAALVARPLFEAFGLGAEAVDSGVAHFRTLLAGSAFAYVGFAFGGVFAAIRNTRTPLVCGAISSV
ncbi:MAG TPA: MATE family efflux transporter, partial [Kofleriaceae bacterium]